MEWVLLWFGLSVVAGVIAAHKGRSGAGFFILSLFLSPLIGVLAAWATQPNLREIEAEKVASGEAVKCPYCAELVRTEAVVCKHCGRDLGGAYEAKLTDAMMDRMAHQKKPTAGKS